MRTLLMINIPPTLEEDMVDYLLALDDVDGFTTFAVNGHGEGSYANVAEQVSGHRRRIHFEVLVEPGTVGTVIAGLANQVGKGIHYWYLPVSGFGQT
ncbi:hypothetical protein GCM10011403_23250 [Pseudohongiella nitratireducens]|uniref:DUF3240 domain-containing protein n=1 Tax=Pseudohongiella nitratireducens TaxID=1768907 RepID=A0A916QMA9_9GAMM|nr:DUF3240 family protein [Pseudohongiella nitratireducens]MDF1623427.1 DUF3240 family protein [Pseudohongiella nitratireducens]GFZ79548.1 hypothetical protein GCM10011403_23250 [Pseudohongiella nitratireducens]|tara:strand:+ start:2624 stop:2914 length:291 start_codon:yes stop_codon:yes gene_type:complete